MKLQAYATCARTRDSVLEAEYEQDDEYDSYVESCNPELNQAVICVRRSSDKERE